MLLLREMELKDSAGIAELELEIFSDAWTEKSIRETFYQSHAFMIGAEENMELKGYAIVYHVLDEAEVVRIVSELENLDIIESVYSFIMGMLSVKKGGAE